MEGDGTAVRGAARRDGRTNAFDLLRLLGAVAVLVEHSWLLSGHGYPLPAETGATFGRVGVGVFFLTSGYLVTSSWLADPSTRRFLLRRMLRIYPLYTAVVVVSALVLGPLLTDLTPSRYYADGRTWSYVGDNLLLFPTAFELPGVFTDGPVSNAVNGALWTIPTEVLCYFGVMVLGIVGVVRRRALLAVAATIPVGVAFAVTVTGFTGTLVPRLLDGRAAEQIALFAVGMVVYHLPMDQRPGWRVAGIAIAAWILTWGTPLAGVTAAIVIATSTLAIAFGAPGFLRHPTGHYDLSYGTYLFAFPVQQCLIGAGITNPWAVLSLTIVIVIPLATVSWRYVESPALRLKPRTPVRTTSGGPSRNEPVARGMPPEEDT